MKSLRCSRGRRYDDTISIMKTQRTKDRPSCERASDVGCRAHRCAIQYIHTTTEYPSHASICVSCFLKKSILVYTAFYIEYITKDCYLRFLYLIFVIILLLILVVLIRVFGVPPLWPVNSSSFAFAHFSVQSLISFGQSVRRKNPIRTYSN